MALTAADAPGGVRPRIRSSAPRWPVELAGLAAGGALAIAVTAAVLGGGIAPLLLYDGDSQLPLLWRASIWAGQPQDWVLSSPLFLIELVLYAPVVLLPLPNPVTIALISIIGWTFLYVVCRALAAALGLRRVAGVMVSLVVVAIPAAEAALEQSPTRNTMELAALLSPATYYSGTLLASVGALALAVRILRRARHRMRIVVALGALVLVGTTSNPLLVAWTAAPLALIALLLALRPDVRRPALLILAAVVGGSVLGVVARIPFAWMLVGNSVGKVQPSLAGQSLLFYGQETALRIAGPGGIAELVIAVAAFLVAVVVLVVAVVSGSAPGMLAAGFTVLGPVATTIGSIALGTFATRYLMPVEFFPPLAVAALIALRPRASVRIAPRAGRPLRAATGIVAAAALVAAGLGVVSLSRTLAVPDRSLACAVDWIDAHHEPGAGQYWSVRQVKAAIADPRWLVQTTSDLHAYAWLIDLDDFRTHRVYFTITDAESPPFALSRRPVAVVPCGRYTIDDYGTRPLEIGPPEH